MRRLGFLALIVMALAGCQQQSAGGAFSDRPSAVPTAVATRRLDFAALQKLRAQAAAALSAHTSGGEVAVTWGTGGASPLTGPYREDRTAADTLGLLATRSLAAHPSGGPGDSLSGQATALAASATAASRQIEGAQGAAYLLMAEASPIPASGPSATDTPNPGGPPAPRQE